jgi:transketolase C-terminal domain/subunit
MALDDIAMFRAIDESTVLVTSDANQAAALVDTMLDHPASPTCARWASPSR